MEKHVWKLKTDPKFQKEWDLFKNDYSTENYQLKYVFEIYLPFWQVKQNVVVEKNLEADRFTRILLQLISDGMCSHSEICNFLGVDYDNFCKIQFHFLIKNGLIREFGEENYEITHEGLSFLENKTKLTTMEQNEFEFMTTEKTTYLKSDLTGNFFDPSHPLDVQLSAEKKEGFSGYHVLESHKIKEILKDKKQIGHENRPTFKKLAEVRNDFSAFFNKQFEDRIFYDFADAEVESHKRNICFLAFLYQNKDNFDDIKVDIRQFKDSVNEFEKYELERMLSKQTTEYVLKNVTLDFGVKNKVQDKLITDI